MLPAHKLEIGTEPLAEPARNPVSGRPFLDLGQDSRYWTLRSRFTRPRSGGC